VLLGAIRGAEARGWPPATDRNGATWLANRPSFTYSPRVRVQEAKVLRGVPLLDQAALDAVRQWVYSISLVDGVPVPVIMTVTVSFRLG
jgi:hypothetical protein